MNRRLLLIDSCLGVGSTGRITESIAKKALHHGWECFIAHGARYVNHNFNNPCINTIQTSTKFGEYIHYVEGLLFDNHGLSSRISTKRFVEILKEINPDIVHLHCIHGYYLNYKLLFEYLNSTNIPVVWTFHDCWAFTGHCSHFVTIGCEKWKTECYECPLKNEYPKSLVDRSSQNYYIKKRLFASNNNIHIVTVCEWMNGLIKESFLKDKKVSIINNGIDISTFKPVSNTQCKTKKTILGVSSVWNRDKGLFDFFKLLERIDSNKFEICLIGLEKKQIKELPQGILGLERTASVEDLAGFYSKATVFVNPTYADTFPTVNLEALACGTPVVTYDTGGSPEAIDSQTGRVVKQGDIQGLADAIEDLSFAVNNTNIRSLCRERALMLFDSNNVFEKYINLYTDILSNKC